MFSYEYGLMVAFLIWIFSLIHLVVMINSQLEKNLNKIGQKLSWLTLTPLPMYGNTKKRPFWQTALKFILLVALGTPFVFLSWLYVLCVVGMALYSWSKNIGKPVALKEFQWKMRNIDMSFDEIIRASMKAADIDPSKFEDVKQETLNLMSEA